MLVGRETIRITGSAYAAAANSPSDRTDLYFRWLAASTMNLTVRVWQLLAINIQILNRFLAKTEYCRGCGDDAADKSPRNESIFLRVNKSHSDDLLVLCWHPSSLDYRGDVRGIFGRTRAGHEVRLSLIEPLTYNRFPED